jgi:hypothetical protein
VPDQTALGRDALFGISTLAALAGAFFAVFMVLGAGFATIVFAVARDGVLAEFARAFWAIADIVTADHDWDSIGVVVGVPHRRSVLPV